jgi:hypothetical protein
MATHDSQHHGVIAAVAIGWAAPMWTDHTTPPPITTAYPRVQHVPPVASSSTADWDTVATEIEDTVPLTSNNRTQLLRVIEALLGTTQWGTPPPGTTVRMAVGMGLVSTAIYAWLWWTLSN